MGVEEFVRDEVNIAGQRDTRISNNDKLSRRYLSKRGD
jgi:hypothetical protein